MTAPGTEQFTTALFATNRAAFSRFVAARGLPLVDAAAKAAARAAFDAQELLHAPELVALCGAAVAGAVGQAVENVTITIWEHLRRTADGVPYSFTWSGLASQHATWATMVAPKGEGNIYSPITTDNGERLTAHTKRIHILTLDCDGTGTWDALWRVLVELGIAAVTHQSGGFTPATPKWRVLIPLAIPFDTETGDGGTTWRMAYATARVAFGALARLRGAGFDPATDNANNAWFPGYRREPAAAPRQVLYTGGRTLDLARLTAALPAPTMSPAAVTRRTWTTTAPSLLELAFEEACLLGSALTRGLSAVVCPWNDCHSAPLASNVSPTSASVIFPPNSAANVGAFFCAHASCGAKSVEEVLAMLPEEAVHRARLRHVRSTSPSASWLGGTELPSLPAGLPRLPTELP
ncbi:hypothetical protein [Anaeromyxobacter sp. SG66]|uniref:hypothetical protein n=1 Tax=Anaeromyxobacter sp. SG66 TaxID=2925410 RepID=UPI001F56AF40|nr:hypothetical protein [Anaeromyxobacter sp. SG66]